MRKSTQFREISARKTMLNKKIEKNPPKNYVRNFYLILGALHGFINEILFKKYRLKCQN